MSGHDFEKQVRQKLNDLKMTPSAEAWENIEESLREKKRRLAPVFWLPLLLIGLAAGGYLFFRPFGDKDQLSTRKEVKTTVQPQVKTSEPQASGSSSAPQLTANNNSSESQVKSPVTTPQETSSSSAPQVSSKNNSPAPQSENKNLNVASGRVLNYKNVAPQVKAPALLAKTPVSLTTSAEKFLSSFNKIPSLYTSNEKSKINAPSLPIINTASSKPSIQKKKTSKWSYGLSGVAGVSSVSEGDFFNLNFNRAEVEDVAMVAAFAPQPYRPSSISSDFTFSLGGFVKRELSKKFSLSVGVNYLQINTRNKVGSRINARQVVNNGNRGYMFVSSYYTLQQDQPSEYRNRYHFVEVPVELHTRLNKSEKVQLFLNTGMAVSQLLKSNSLHFDGSSGVYYKNDKLLNQTQLATKVGFSFGLLNNTTRPIWVGPYARYNISRILEKDVSASKSFASFGLDMKLFIR